MRGDIPEKGCVNYYHNSFGTNHIGPTIVAFLAWKKQAFEQGWPYIFMTC